MSSWKDVLRVTLLFVDAKIVANDLNNAFFSGCHWRFLPKRFENGFGLRTQAFTEPTRSQQPNRDQALLLQGFMYHTQGILGKGSSREARHSA